MKCYKRALVVGKFCPLHRGHQLLLDRAQGACEELLIVSYTKPEFPGMAPARREGWLRALYPQAAIVVLDDDRLAACARRAVLPPVDCRTMNSTMARYTAILWAGCAGRY